MSRKVKRAPRAVFEQLRRSAETTFGNARVAEPPFLAALEVTATALERVMRESDGLERVEPFERG